MLLVGAFLLVGGGQLRAQEASAVSGVVSDQNGPIIGASVIEKGKPTNGASTDATGRYYLTVPSNATLTVSYLGYQSQDVAVGDRTTGIDVTLAEDSKNLDEVVVIGYGTQRKEAVTGSVASMSGADMREVAASNVTYALQGRMAGLDMTQTSSRPGAEMQIRIRGTRSLNASNDPLVVLDGIPFAGAIGDIDPSIIKSIDVLKDASATAIYGSRGANGVILITTARGLQGQKAHVTYNGYYGIKDIFSKYPMMEGAEFEEWRAEANKNGANYVLGTNEKSGLNTDWQDLVFQKGYVTSHNIGVAGGTTNGAYSFGGGFYKEETVLPGQDFSRFSLRGTFDQKVGIFRFGLTTQNAYSITHGESNNPMYQIISLPPIVDPYDADGKISHVLEYSGLDQSYNPLEIYDYGDKWVQERKNFSSYNALFGEADIYDGLKYRVNVGLNYRQSNYGNYIGQQIVYNNFTGPSNATISNGLTTNWAVENLLTYDKIFAEKHSLNVVAMYSAEQTEYAKSQVYAEGIPADFIQHYNLGLATGSQTINSADQDYYKRGLISYMARVAYSYDSRYMLMATLRNDGASVLAKGHKWHLYPAVSVGWNIKNESFMQSVNFVDQLKLRVGYGQTSNASISPYATLGALSNRYYNFGNQNVTGYYVSDLPNEKLGWEYSTTWNFGLDFTLLDKRLSGTLEYYIQKTDDVLLQLSLPITSGVANPYWANIGKTENKGLELSLNYAILQNLNGWSWDVGFNIYGNRNKLVSLASGGEKDIANGWFVGQPIDVVYDYKKIGIWQTNDPMGNVTDYEGDSGKTGMIKVEYTGDYDSNGIPTRVIGTDDRQVLGSLEPDFQGGFNTRVAYKGFDLSIVGVFKHGGLLVSSLYSSSSYLNLNNGRRGNVKVDYWTATNPTNAYPAPAINSTTDNQKYSSTLAYFDASYLKIRAMTLGYTLPKNWLQRVGIDNVRVYFTVQNPFVLFSPYYKESGMDPETNSPARENQAVASNSTQPTRQPTVAYNTPATRNYLFGLSLSF
ncbi:SusC/RagA family TonB-linked outer membrane protein [Bacteroidia bacterium]|nr:SusC/RagA family TonB-linked outer membrane protein [Bacteroidia bacterium]